MQNTTKFQRVLERLNDKQREAVETIYGPVMVIAGPGSGKTQLLSARIAYILQNTDYLPHNILCLTFTENAAKNMRERLANMIGHEAYKVAIHTFHSFGNEIINRYRSYAREYSEAKVIDDISSSKFLDDILKNLPWDHPYKPGYTASDMIYELKNTIGDLKKGGLTPNDYKNLITQNAETLDIINPLVQKYFSKIDALGRKKEDNEKKKELFFEFAKEVKRATSSHKTSILNSFSSKEKEATNEASFFLEEKIVGGYFSLLQTIIYGLEDTLSQQDEKGSTKFITAWKSSWTQKNYSGERELKEVAKIKKQLALADIFEKYQEVLKHEGYIDFSDMLLQAIDLIETHEEIRLNLAENYQCVMIDEFQDTNQAQMQLIHSIISVNPEDPNIFAVGDDDQSIYKFQGANTKNLRDFVENYNDTKLIILEKNYRSKAEIIQTSRDILTPELHSLERIFPGSIKKFEAFSGTGGVIQKYSFDNEIEEYSCIAENISKQIELGTAPENIAIICKKNKSLELLAKVLLEKNIPVHVSKEESLFDTDEVQILVKILKLLDALEGGSGVDQAELLVSILTHPVFGIERLTLWKLSKQIYHARRETTKSWIENLRIHDDPKLRDLAHFLIELAQQSRTNRLEDIIDHITGASHLNLPSDYEDEEHKQTFELTLLSGQTKEYVSPVYAYFFEKPHTIFSSRRNGATNSGLSLLGGERIKSEVSGEIKYTKYLTNIKKFIETIRSYKSGKTSLELRDAIDILSLIEKYKINLSSSHLLGNPDNAVSLITVHKAKGLEWKHVYVPFLTSSEYKIGKFGGSALPKNLPLEAEKDSEEDIERLVYTALTRAEHSLTLTYSDFGIDEKTRELLPCFGSKIDEFERITFTSQIKLQNTLELENTDFFALPYLGFEHDFMREQVSKNFTMNATALQSFLNIVDSGPELFVKRNLLRFPQSKNIAASYGSAMHKGLEDFFNDYIKNGSYSQDILIQSFESSLTQEGFDPVTEQDYLQKGRDNLTELYPEITRKKYGNLALEYDFRSAYGGIFLQNPNGEAIRLTGKIDRIEILEDESLIITDYKTGKGFDDFSFTGFEYNKIKQWKYKLQLCFYAILFELSPRWKGYKQKQYELFFVEKNIKENRFHIVREYVQAGEIERTKKLICAVMNKIQNLEFMNTSHYPKTLEGIRQFEEDLIEGEI